MAKKFSKKHVRNSKPLMCLTITPVGKGAFQHPDLVKLGDEISANYHHSFNEAKDDVIERRLNRKYPTEDVVLSASMMTSSQIQAESSV